METRALGKTGIAVTELCFGALPMGPLQKNLSIEENSQIIAHALSSGINFIDTAEMYRTYEPIALAMKKTGIRPIIASKSNKKTYEGMEAAVNEALLKLGVDYIDIFHLHAARERQNAFELFRDALQCLKDLKARDKVKAIGISTHSAAVTALAAENNDIDIVFPIINMAGLGILDGSKEDMEAAIEKCSRAGKGVYLMKVLAGGSLLSKYGEALAYARRMKGYASIAMGMTAVDEVDYNISYFNGEEVADISKTSTAKKALVFRALCKSCKKCIVACPNEAIFYDEENKAEIDKSRCLTCGYCAPACPEFAIRVV
ncbi:MAG: aldo/keto reductase [Bacillota bacterium]